MKLSDDPQFKKWWEEVALTQVPPMTNQIWGKVQVAFEAFQAGRKAESEENVRMRDALRQVAEYAFHPERSVAQEMTEAERLSAVGAIATAARGNIKD